MSALTLLIPTPAANRIAERKLPFPALENFLARCVPEFEAGGSTIGWMCASFGIQRQRDWPVAAILVQATGALTGATFWLCAQPVHLAVNRDALVLLPPAQLHLPDAQSRTLFGSLEAHCAALGLQMMYIDAGMWCIGSQRRQDLATTEIERVQGRSVNDALASGGDARWWQRLTVELQMVLHQHPVNVAREDSGEAPVNSVWLWGGGTAQDVQQRFDTMCVDHPLLRAIAGLSGARVLDSACDINSVLNGNRSLVELACATDNDVDACLSRLETDWMAPAWQALGKGPLKELNMVFAQPEGLVICRCDSRARWRFWRRPAAFRRLLVRWKQGH